MDPKLFGQQLQFYRTLQRMPQRVLARRVGLTQSRISDIESGHFAQGNPVVREIAAVLGVPMEFDSLPTDDLDVAVRVMRLLAFRPEWVAAWFPEIPLKTVRAYFKGEPIKREHAEIMTRAAWRVVQAAQNLLLETSLDSPGATTDPRWLAFSRRIYDCGSLLKEADRGN